MTTDFPSLLNTVLEGNDLTLEQCYDAMVTMMSGSTDPVHIAGLLVALRSKGETAQELAGFVRGMQSQSVRLELEGPLVDIVGTGGDRSHTVNISTMAALLVAACGHRVVKHGNRAASSSSGSADVLAALGINLDLTPERVAAVLNEADITFCFAQTFHPAMRHVAPTRKLLGVPTVFNLLGPLTNPAGAQNSAVGIGVPGKARLVADVLADRGDSALVFRGDDGLDELTVCTTSTVWWVRDGNVTQHQIDPADLGIRRAELADLRGGDPAHNAQVARDVVNGAPGPIRDAVVLNAAAALVAAGDGEGSLTDRLADGVDRARAAIDSGSAARVLERWANAATR